MTGGCLPLDKDLEAVEAQTVTSLPFLLICCTFERLGWLGCRGQIDRLLKHGDGLERSARLALVLLLLLNLNHRAFLIFRDSIQMMVMMLAELIILFLLLLNRPYLLILSADQCQIQLNLANLVKHLAYLLILLLLLLFLVLVLHLPHAFLLHGLLRRGSLVVPLRNGRVGHNDL